MRLPPNRTIRLLGVLTIAVTTPPAAAQQSRLGVEWNDYAPHYRRQTDRRVTVICPARGTPSAVYGTGVYSDNSSICGAATHAGVIDAVNGGVVTIVIAPGASSYQGSAQNGVTSMTLGSFAGSLTLEQGNVPGQVDWATSAVGLSRAGKPVTLVCPAGGTVGRVWGSDLYTEDSSICSAATHAGVITPRSGGAIVVEGAGPQERFSASTQNGVTSLEWKAWPTSFRVSAARLATVATRPARPAAPTGTTASGTVGITLSATNGLVTTESGNVATFTVRLNTPPTSDVVIPLATSMASEGTVSPTSLTFTASNWMTPQTVTVRGIDDRVVDGNQPYTIRTLPVQAAGDSSYHNLNAADVTVTNNDDDVAGVLARPTSGLVTTEAGGTATFTIELTSQPTAAVTINVSSSNPQEGTVSPASVSFNATNWSTPQTITVRGVADSTADGVAGYSIITSNAVSTDPRYNGLAVEDVVASNREQ